MRRSATPFYIVSPFRSTRRLLEELLIVKPAGWDGIQSHQQLPARVSETRGCWPQEDPVLAVPSVIVPEERNYILNPNHLHFPEVQIGSAGCVLRSILGCCECCLLVVTDQFLNRLPMAAASTVA